MYKIIFSMNRVALSIILAGSIVFASCNKKQPPPVLPTPVNLYTVAAKHVLYYDNYPATTEALNQVNLLPQVQGGITGIFFTEGTLVKKGQKLYEIDRRLYQQNYDAAVANLNVQQQNEKQAQQDADRYEYLNNENAVAKQVYDHAVIALQSAKDQVQSSEQAVKTAQTNLGYSTVYAPFNGTIGFSMVKLGDVVNVGQTILNTISTDDPLAVDFLVNEKQLPKFEKMQANNHPIDSLFTIVMSDNSIYPYLGKISVIDRAVDPQTGSIRIRLVFPNPKDDLKPGMSCVLRVHNQDAAPQLVIPNKAVVEQMGEYFVFVVKDTLIVDSTQKETSDTAQQQGPKLYAFEKKIQIGQTIGPNIIVTDGLAEGDKIVIDGIQSLHDGSLVTTSNKPAEGKGKDNGGNNTGSPKSN
jgi:RND family efflux transporter MFP subunit